MVESSIKTKQVVFVLLVLVCLSGLISAPIALFLGLVVALTFGNPFEKRTGKFVHLLLQVSVVGLGFGMNINQALKVGKEGFWFTVGTITMTITAGWLLNKIFKTDSKTSYLTSCGTAICGGSAIAAVAPLIKADQKQISVSLGTVFILNSVALFVFPIIGHLLNMSQSNFGLWSAIAIHDTSSVVGAASKYGNEALQVATTVKLARALWIIPLSFVTALVYKSGTGKIKIPYFIGFFVLATIVNTYVPAIKLVAPSIIFCAKAGLTLTLFLIGSGLSKATIKNVGFKPMLQGVLLWVLIGSVSLFFVQFFGR